MALCCISFTTKVIHSQKQHSFLAHPVDSRNIKETQKHNTLYNKTKQDSETQQLNNTEWPLYFVCYVDKIISSYSYKAKLLCKQNVRPIIMW